MGRHLEVARDIFIRALVGPEADYPVLAKPRHDDA
jgi:hypothetical protein